jgi:hypothetical protein
MRMNSFTDGNRIEPLMEGDLGPRDAAAGKELGELGLLAKDERRCQHICRRTSAFSDGDIHEYLVAAA